MTTPTTPTASTPITSALARIKALRDQMEAEKAAGIVELKALITEKGQELADLHRQLAELTGEDSEAPKQRRQRGPNKAKETIATADAQQIQPQAVEPVPAIG